jgi:uncharacterized damage-inducible protein DinB
VSLTEFLVQPVAFAPPPHILEDLGDSDAFRRVEGAPHTVAEIVAHMVFWQEWFLDRCRGVDAPVAQHASDGWPPVAAGSWDQTHQRFLGGLKEAVSLASDDARAAARLAPAIAFPPLAHYTVRDALTHIAVHNAHHLGQIVMLRQLMGRWPPPSGSWTW